MLFIAVITKSSFYSTGGWVKTCIVEAFDESGAKKSVENAVRAANKYDMESGSNPVLIEVSAVNSMKILKVCDLSPDCDPEDD